MAAAILNGALIKSAMSVTFSDPTSRGMMLYLGSSLTGCQMNSCDPATRRGASIAPGVTSRCTTSLVKMGRASRATKIRIKMIDAIEVKATRRSKNSATRSTGLARRFKGEAST